MVSANTKTGTFREAHFPSYRTATLDTLELGLNRHLVPLLFEVDVTEAQARFRNYRERTNERLSFTGWVMVCIGRALQEHKHVHAMRRGRRGLVIFDDVDISVVVERAVEPGNDRADTLPMPLVVRKANEKTVQQIHDEIRGAQREALGDGAVQLGVRYSSLGARAFSMLPSVLRNLLVWRRLLRDPFFAKKTMGTVVVSSVGSAGRSSGYVWGIPISIHPVSFTLGSIARKPGMVGEKIAVREFLCVTMLFDHDVTDGAPVARFVDRLKVLLESSYGLPE